MVYKPEPKKLFGGLLTIVGGIKEFAFTELSDTEVAAFDVTFNNCVDFYNKISPVIGETFKKARPFLLDLACIAKARFDNKPINEQALELPASGQMGGGPIIPYDLSKAWVTGTWPGDAKTVWDISLTAGTIAYLIGGSDWWFKTSSTTEKRSMIGIVKDGIFEIDATPALNQLRFETERVSYAPWRCPYTIIQTIEKEKTVYQYNVSGNLILNPDLGVKLSAMPFKSKTAYPFPVGMTFYEYAYHSALRWNTAP